MFPSLKVVDNQLWKNSSVSGTWILSKSVNPNILQIKQVVVASPTQFYILDEDGSVFFCGTETSPSIVVPASILVPIKIDFGNAVFTKIAAGNNFLICLKSDGTLWGIGDNTYGQLGQGNTDPVTTLTQIGTDSNWSDIICGYDEVSTYALKSNGTLWGCGENTSGQLGQGNTDPLYTLTQIGTDSNWSKIACGDNFLIALKSTGTLWSCGYNGEGQLGQGNTDPLYTLTQIGSDTNWSKITCGIKHTLALKSTGTLWGTGCNENYELGLGENVNKSVFTQIGVDSNWNNIFCSCGSSTSFAIKTNGELYYFGVNSLGEACVGNYTSPVTTPTLHTYISNVLGVSSNQATLMIGNDKYCYGSAVPNTPPLLYLMDTVVLESGELPVTCVDTGIWKRIRKITTLENNEWSESKSVYKILACGLNKYGEAFKSSYDSKLSFDKCIDDNDWKYVYTLGTQAVVISYDGQLYSIGYSTTTGFATQIASDDENNNNFVKAFCDSNSIFAIKNDGSLWALGNNDYGQLCLGDTNPRYNLTKVGTDTDWDSVHLYGNLVVGLKTDGTLWIGGQFAKNYYGSLTYTFTRLSTESHFVKVFMGYQRFFAIKSDGTLWGFGDNQYGKLGLGSSRYIYKLSLIDNSLGGWSWMSCQNTGSVGICNGNLYLSGRFFGTTISTTFIPVPDIYEAFTEVSSGSNFTIGICSDKTLYCIGYNTYGQLGAWNFVNQTSIIQNPNISGAKHIYCNNNSSIVMKENGTFVAAGRYYNEPTNSILTRSTYVNPFKKIRKIDDLSEYTKTQAVSNAALYLKTDGSLFGKGYNNLASQGGIFGKGTTSLIQDITQLDIYDVKDIFMVTNSVFIIKNDNSLWVTGKNTKGQLGLGHTTNVYYFTKVDSSSWKQVCGSSSCLGIKTDGTLWGTGENAISGALGFNDSNDRTTFEQVGSDNDWESISVSEHHTDYNCSFAIKTNGTLWSCGYNYNGQLGLGNQSQVRQFTQVGSDTDWAKVFVSRNHTLALKDNGTLWVCGNNEYGQLGNGSYGGDINSFFQVGTDTDWAQIFSGILCSIAIKTNGALYVFGRDTGNLGLGNTSMTMILVPTRELTNTISNYAVANENIVGIDNNKHLRVCGDNGTQGLPILLSTCNRISKTIGEPSGLGLRDVVSVNSSGNNNVIMKLKNDGIYASGTNENSIFGISPSTLDKSYAYSRTVNDKFKKISIGVDKLFALNYCGEIYASGHNVNGELGNGTTNEITSLTKITHAKRFIDIATSTNHSIALAIDLDEVTAGSYLKTLWGCGNNTYGQLTNLSSPNIFTQIGSDTDWYQVLAGENYSLALKYTGGVYNLYGTGDNSKGQLGLGATSSVNTLTLLDAVNSIISFSCGNDYTMYVTSSGTLFASGNNDYGQLGTGDKVSLNTFTQIGSDTDWTKVFCGEGKTVAVKSTGAVYICGYNVGGCLGVGDDSEHLSLTLLTGMTCIKASFIKSGTLLIDENYNLFITGNNYITNQYNEFYGLGSTINCKNLEELFRSIYLEWQKSESTLKEFSAGGNFIYRLSNEDGNVYCKGLNTFGQLGTMDETDRVEVFENITNFASKIFCGKYNAFVIFNDGVLLSTGKNTSGQLGIGTTSNISELSIVLPEVTTWSKIFPGLTYSLGLRENGDLYGTGDPQTSLFTTGSSFTQINGKYLDMNGSHNDQFLIDENNDLYGIGTNANGELGLGDTTPRTSLTKIGGSSKFSKVICLIHDETSCSMICLKTDGTIWGAGRNLYGELGQGNYTQQNTLIQIGSASDWIDICCGDKHFIAQNEDHEIWGCGDNSFGQLNLDNQFRKVNTLTQIGTLNDNEIIKCGSYSTYILK